MDRTPMKKVLVLPRNGAVPLEDFSDKRKNDDPRVGETTCKLSEEDIVKIALYEYFGENYRNELRRQPNSFSATANRCAEMVDPSSHTEGVKANYDNVNSCYDDENASQESSVTHNPSSGNIKEKNEQLEVLETNSSVPNCSNRLSADEISEIIPQTDVDPNDLYYCWEELINNPLFEQQTDPSNSDLNAGTSPKKLVKSVLASAAGEALESKVNRVMETIPEDSPKELNSSLDSIQPSITILLQTPVHGIVSQKPFNSLEYYSKDIDETTKKAANALVSLGNSQWSNNPSKSESDLPSQSTESKSGNTSASPNSIVPTLLDELPELNGVKTPNNLQLENSKDNVSLIKHQFAKTKTDIPVQASDKTNEILLCSNLEFSNDVLKTLPESSSSVSELILAPDATLPLEKLPTCYSSKNNVDKKEEELLCKLTENVTLNQITPDLTTSKCLRDSSSSNKPKEVDISTPPSTRRKRKSNKSKSSAKKLIQDALHENTPLITNSSSFDAKCSSKEECNKTPPSSSSDGELTPPNYQKRSDRKRKSEHDSLNIKTAQPGIRITRTTTGSRLMNEWSGQEHESVRQALKCAEEASTDCQNVKGAKGNKVIGETTNQFSRGKRISNKASKGEPGKSETTTRRFSTDSDESLATSCTVSNETNDTNGASKSVVNRVGKIKNEPKKKTGKCKTHPCKSEIQYHGNTETNITQSNDIKDTTQCLASHLSIQINAGITSSNHEGLNESVENQSTGSLSKREFLQKAVEELLEKSNCKINLDKSYNTNQHPRGKPRARRGSKTDYFGSPPHPSNPGIVPSCQESFDKNIGSTDYKRVTNHDAGSNSLKQMGPGVDECLQPELQPNSGNYSKKIQQKKKCKAKQSLIMQPEFEHGEMHHNASVAEGKNECNQRLLKFDQNKESCDGLNLSTNRKQLKSDTILPDGQERTASIIQESICINTNGNPLLKHEACQTNADINIISTEKFMKERFTDVSEQAAIPETFMIARQDDMGEGSKKPFNASHQLSQRYPEVPHNSFTISSEMKPELLKPNPLEMPKIDNKNNMKGIMESRSDGKPVLGNMCIVDCRNNEPLDVQSNDLNKALMNPHPPLHSSVPVHKTRRAEKKRFRTRSETSIRRSAETGRELEEPTNKGGISISDSSYLFNPSENGLLSGENSPKAFLNKVGEISQHSKFPLRSSRRKSLGREGASWLSLQGKSQDVRSQLCEKNGMDSVGPHQSLATIVDQVVQNLNSVTYEMERTSLTRNLRSRGGLNVKTQISGQIVSEAKLAALKMETKCTKKDQLQLPTNESTSQALPVPVSLRTPSAPIILKEPDNIANGTSQDDRPDGTNKSNLSAQEGKVIFNDEHIGIVKLPKCKNNKTQRLENFDVGNFNVTVTASKESDLMRKTRKDKSNSTNKELESSDSLSREKSAFNSGRKMKSFVDPIQFCEAILKSPVIDLTEEVRPLTIIPSIPETNRLTSPTRKPSVHQMSGSNGFNVPLKPMLSSLNVKDETCKFFNPFSDKVGVFTDSPPNSAPQNAFIVGSKEQFESWAINSNQCGPLVPFDRHESCALNLSNFQNPSVDCGKFNRGVVPQNDFSFQNQNEKLPVEIVNRFNKSYDITITSTSTNNANNSPSCNEPMDLTSPPLSIQPVGHNDGQDSVNSSPQVAGGFRRLSSDSVHCEKDSRQNSSFLTTNLSGSIKSNHQSSFSLLSPPLFNPIHDQDKSCERESKNQLPTLNSDVNISNSSKLDEDSQRDTIRSPRRFRVADILDFPKVNNLNTTQVPHELTGFSESLDINDTAPNHQTCGKAFPDILTNTNSEKVLTEESSGSTIDVVEDEICSAVVPNNENESSSCFNNPLLDNDKNSISKICDRNDDAENQSIDEASTSMNCGNISNDLPLVASVSPVNDVSSEILRPCNDEGNVSHKSFTREIPEAYEATLTESTPNVPPLCEDLLSLNQMENNSKISSSVDVGPNLSVQSTIVEQPKEPNISKVSQYFSVFDPDCPVPSESVCGIESNCNENAQTFVLSTESSSVANDNLNQNIEFVEQNDNPMTTIDSISLVPQESNIDVNNCVAPCPEASDVNDGNEDSSAFHSDGCAANEPIADVNAKIEESCNVGSSKSNETCENEKVKGTDSGVEDADSSCTEALVDSPETHEQESKPYSEAVINSDHQQEPAIDSDKSSCTECTSGYTADTFEEVSEPLSGTTVSSNSICELLDHKEEPIVDSEKPLCTKITSGCSPEFQEEVTGEYSNAEISSISADEVIEVSRLEEPIIDSNESCTSHCTVEPHEEVSEPHLNATSTITESDSITPEEKPDTYSCKSLIDCLPETHEEVLEPLSKGANNSISLCEQLKQEEEPTRLLSSENTDSFPETNEQSTELLSHTEVNLLSTSEMLNLEEKPTIDSEESLCSEMITDCIPKIHEGATDPDSPNKPLSPGELFTHKKENIANSCNSLLTDGLTEAYTEKPEPESDKGLSINVDSHEEEPAMNSGELLCSQMIADGSRETCETTESNSVTATNLIIATELQNHNEESIDKCLDQPDTEIPAKSEECKAISAPDLQRNEVDLSVDELSCSNNVAVPDEVSVCASDESSSRHSALSTTVNGCSVESEKECKKLDENYDSSEVSIIEEPPSTPHPQALPIEWSTLTSNGGETVATEPKGRPDLNFFNITENDKAVTDTVEKLESSSCPNDSSSDSHQEEIDTDVSEKVIIPRISSKVDLTSVLEDSKPHSKSDHHQSDTNGSDNFSDPCEFVSHEFSEGSPNSLLGEISKTDSLHISSSIPKVYSKGCSSQKSDDVSKGITPPPSPPHFPNELSSLQRETPTRVIKSDKQQLATSYISTDEAKSEDSKAVQKSVLELSTDHSLQLDVHEYVPVQIKTSNDETPNLTEGSCPSVSWKVGEMDEKTITSPSGNCNSSPTLVPNITKEGDVQNKTTPYHTLRGRPSQSAKRKLLENSEIVEKKLRPGLRERNKRTSRLVEDNITNERRGCRTSERLKRKRLQNLETEETSTVQKQPVMDKRRTRNYPGDSTYEVKGISEAALKAPESYQPTGCLLKLVTDREKMLSGQEKRSHSGELVVGFYKDPKNDRVQNRLETSSHLSNNRPPYFSSLPLPIETNPERHRNIFDYLMMERLKCPQEKTLVPVPHCRELTIPKQTPFFSSFRANALLPPTSEKNLSPLSHGPSYVSNNRSATRSSRAARNVGEASCSSFSPSSRHNQTLSTWKNQPQHSQQMNKSNVFSLGHQMPKMTHSYNPNRPVVVRENGRTLGGVGLQVVEDVMASAKTSHKAMCTDVDSFATQRLSTCPLTKERILGKAVRGINQESVEEKNESHQMSSQGTEPVKTRFLSDEAASSTPVDVGELPSKKKRS